MIEPAPNSGQKPLNKGGLSRREFIKAGLGALAALAQAACGLNSVNNTPESKPTLEPKQPEITSTLPPKEPLPTNIEGLSIDVAYLQAQSEILSQNSTSQESQIRPTPIASNLNKPESPPAPFIYASSVFASDSFDIYNPLHVLQLSVAEGTRQGTDGGVTYYQKGSTGEYALGGLGLYRERLEIPQAEYTIKSGFPQELVLKNGTYLTIVGVSADGTSALVSFEEFVPRRLNEPVPHLRFANISIDDFQTIQGSFMKKGGYDQQKRLFAFTATDGIQRNVGLNTISQDVFDSLKDQIGRVWVEKYPVRLSADGTIVEEFGYFPEPVVSPVPQELLQEQLVQEGSGIKYEVVTDYGKTGSQRYDSVRVKAYDNQTNQLIAEAAYDDIKGKMEWGTPFVKLDSGTELRGPSEKLKKEAIESFSNVFGIKSNEIEDLMPKSITGVDNNQRIIMHTHSGHPLIVAAQNTETGKWNWTSDTMRPIFNSLGIKVGSHVDGADENYQTDVYRKTVGNNFDILFPAGAFSQDWIDRAGDDEAQYFIDLAKKNNQIIYIHAGFQRSDQDYLANIPDDQRLARMKERIRTLLQFVKPVDEITQKYPTYICILNEPFARYKNGDGEDTPNWKRESLAMQTLGLNTNALIESYMMFYNEALTQHLRVGIDIFFFYSEYGISSPNVKTEMALREFKKAKNEIAKRLKIPIEEVQFGLSLEQRYDEIDPTTWSPDDWPTDAYGRVIPPTEQDLDITTGKFQEIFGQIIFSEVSDFGGSAEQIQSRFATLLRIANKYHLESIIFEQPLRFNDRDPSAISTNTMLFNKNFSKAREYFELVKDAVDLIG